MLAWGQIKFYLFKKFVCVCEWVKVLAMLKGEGYNSFEGWGKTSFTSTNSSLISIKVVVGTHKF